MNNSEQWKKNSDEWVKTMEATRIKKEDGEVVMDESTMSEYDIEKLEAKLDGIIHAKSELKSQAGILWRRAGNGIWS